MAATAYIIDPTADPGGFNLNLGFYQARLVRNGPIVPVWAQEDVERDEAGDALEDAVYRLWVDGDCVLDWNQRFPRGLMGDAITEAEYRRLIADRAYQKEHMGVSNDPTQPIDLRSMPSILPPGF